MTRDVLWLTEKDAVFVVDMTVAPPGGEQKSKPPFGRHVARHVSHTECTEGHEKGDTEGPHAMSDDEKMEEDKEETSSEVIEHEEQKGRASESACTCRPDIPSRRKVKDHN